MDSTLAVVIGVVTALIVIGLVIGWVMWWRKNQRLNNLAQAKNDRWRENSENSSNLTDAGNILKYMKIPSIYGPQTSPPLNSSSSMQAQSNSGNQENDEDALTLLTHTKDPEIFTRRGAPGGLFEEKEETV